MRVLIVDDDEFMLSVIERTLVRMGHEVSLARDGREALDVLKHGQARNSARPVNQTRLNPRSDLKAFAVDSTAVGSVTKEIPNLCEQIERLAGSRNLDSLHRLLDDLNFEINDAAAYIGSSIATPTTTAAPL